MSLLLFGSGSDQYKPDSTATNRNGDDVVFTGANIIIDTVAHVTPGATSYKVAITSLAGGLGTLNGAASAAELVDIFVFSIDGSGYVLANITEQYVWGQSSTRTSYAQMSIKKNGASTTDVIGTFYYDNVAIGTYNFAIGASVKTYRVAVYMKLGTVGVGNSTYKVYVDDVTSADIAVGAATQQISTTTATFTNSPASLSSMLIGNASKGIGFGSLVYWYEHLQRYDTAGSGSGANPSARALDPCCVTKRSAPIAAGAETGWAVSGTFADLDEYPPDDVTTKVEGAIAFGGTAINATYLMDVWATIGNSTGDEILGVRVVSRARSGDGINTGAAGLSNIFREGGTDTVSSGSVGVGTAWSEIVASTGSGRIPIQQTPPTSGGTWTITLFNAVEAGVRATDSGTIGAGNTAHPQVTELRKDACFIKKPAVSTVSPRVVAIMQAVNRASTY